MPKFIECEACHNVLSDQVAFCPKCGNPVRWKAVPAKPTTQSEWDKIKTVFRTIGGLVVVALVLAIAWSWFGDSSTKHPAKAVASSSAADIDQMSAPAPPHPSPTSQSDDETASPKWIKLGDDMYVLKPFGDIPYASLVVFMSKGQRAFYFLNGGSQLCANQSGMVIKGPVGNYTVNGNAAPYEAVCMGQLELDAPMTPAGSDILRNAVESGRLVKATTSLGDDVAFDPSGLNAALAAPVSSTSTSSPEPETKSETASGSTALGSPDENANVDIRVTSDIPSKNTAQLYTSNGNGSIACLDKTVIPELHYLFYHDRGRQMEVLYNEGRCFDLYMTTFKVLARETLQVPAGPQKIIKIEMESSPESEPPQTPGKGTTAYAMEISARPINQPTPGTP